MVYIDDEPLQAKILAEAFRSEQNPQIELIYEQTLKTGLERLRKGEIDLVLLDLNLGDSRGLDSFTKVHAYAPTLPIVILTCNKDDELAIEALRRGAQDFLIKDFVHPKVVSRVIRYSIERKRMEEAIRYVAQGISAATGNLFFSFLVKNLTKALNIDCAFIGELTGENEDSVHTIAVCVKGEVRENFDFKFADTAAEEVIKKHIRTCASEALHRFPQDPLIREWNAQSLIGTALWDAKGRTIGLLLLMDSQARENMQLAESILQIFATRASAELDRRRAETELRLAREQEVEIGSRIQKTLLIGQPPKDMDNVEFATLSLASQRVAGDFFDFIKHSDDCVDVVVGDVMGKGITAALLGAATKSHFLRAINRLISSSKSPALPEPKDVVNLLHQEMTKQLIDLESFFTVCYARFDFKANQICFVDCGHTKTIHFRSREKKCGQLEGVNMPVGFYADEVYEQASVFFDEGDIFFFYSDGLTEAKSKAGEFFGLERLTRLIDENAHLGMSQLIRCIHRAVVDFSGTDKFSDDLTCVAVRIGLKEKLAPVSHLELTLSGNLSELAQMRSVLRGVCAGIKHKGWTANSIDELELAAQETATNIVLHALHENSAEKISILVDIFSDRVSLEFSYGGDGFDPSAVPQPSFDGSKESGFGLYIVKNCVNEMKYSGDSNGKNSMVLIKKFEL